MKTYQKLAVTLAAVAALSVSTFADQVTIGAEVAPIANLVVLGGNTNMNFADLKTLAGDKASTSVSAAQFMVTTNMPKWNVFFSMANGGILRSKSGASYALKTAFLTIDTDIKACQDDACTVTTLAVNALDNITLIPAKFASVQSLRTMLGVALTPLTYANTDANWIIASGLSTFGGTLKVASNTTPAPTIAGSYTEIVYLTLATSY